MRSIVSPLRGTRTVRDCSRREKGPRSLWSFALFFHRSSPSDFLPFTFPLGVFGGHSLIAIHIEIGLSRLEHEDVAPRAFVRQIRLRNRVCGEGFVLVRGIVFYL